MVSRSTAHALPRLYGSLPSIAAMPQVSVSAERTEAARDARREQLERGVDQEAEGEAEQDERARDQPHLAVHRPRPLRRTARRVLQSVSAGRPAARTAVEVVRGDAVTREPGAGAGRAVARLADEEEGAARRRLPQCGNGPVEPVERDVERAGHVPGGVFAGCAHVDDGQFGQPGAGLVGVEHEGCVHGRCHPWSSTGPRAGE